MDFATELARHGPDGSAPVLDLPSARSYCQRLAGSHYENFPVLSWALPTALRPHFAHVYAYCRWSDDLADEVGDANQSLMLLDWWQNELDRCFTAAALGGSASLEQGGPKHPVMIALATTVHVFELPKQPFLNLLRAFRQDQTKTRYDHFGELREYCAGSADPVGRLVLHLCRRASEANFAMSDAICTGLQLANFWQDVRVDLEKNRIYLPAADMARFGVTEADLRAGEATPAFRQLLAFEVERAERLLRDGLPLARRLPGRLRYVIALFAHGGLAILRKIARQDHDTLTRRPKLGAADVLGIFWRALCDHGAPRRGATNEANPAMEPIASTETP